MHTVPIEDFNVDDIAYETKSSKVLEVILDNDERILVPINYIKGKKPGPTLLILAGVHGDEYEGVQTVIELFSEINIEDIIGTLIMVPVTNFKAYEAISRFSPNDKLNLAREFPGDIGGSYTQKLAWYIDNYFISKADFLLDLHSGGYFYNLPTLVGYYHSNNEPGLVSKKAAEVFGMEVIWGHPDVAKGPTIRAALERGIPWLYTEARGGLRVNSCDQKLYKLGAIRLMNFLKMITQKKLNQFELPDYEIKYRLYGIGNLDSSIKSTTAGFFIPKVKLLDNVFSGDVVGVIYDLNGKKLEVLRAHKSGVVVSMVGNPKVNKNQPMFFITESEDDNI